MKRIFTLFTVLVCALTIIAQPTPQSVSPGSKGELPKLPTLSPARDGEINILSLQYVSYDFSYSCSNEAMLAFPTPADIGADSYTLQRKVHGDTKWTTTNTTISQQGCAIDVTVNYAETDFRLLVNGGAHDGKVTNAVTARIGTGPSTNVVSTYESEDMYKMVGKSIGSTFGFCIEVPGDNNTYVERDQDAGIYNYQWYRKNPYNGDMTLIEGATERTYTPVVEDCGSIIVLEVTGDNRNCNFTLPQSFGMVYLPVQASVAYIGNDGFVLNTDYVIPDPANSFVMYDSYNGTTDDFIPVPDEIVSTRQDGQYVFRTPIENYDGWEFNLMPSGYKLTFAYMVDWGEEPELWYREAQIMPDRYWSSINVKAEVQGQQAPIAGLNIYGYDIDGNITFVRSVAPMGDTDTETEGITVDPDWEDTSGNLFSNNTYFIKVIGEGNTASTYWPDALMWENAQTVTPGYDDNYDPISITVQMQTVEPMAGTAVVAGTIDKNEVAKSRSRHGAIVAAEGSGEETFSVMLKEVGGDIIAQTETDAAGNYRFENVPYNTYELLVSIAGYTLSKPASVTVDEDNPEAYVDYTIGDEGDITPTSVRYVSARGTDEATAAYDLLGRRLVSPAKGLGIIRTPDGKAKTVYTR